MLFDLLLFFFQGFFILFIKYKHDFSEWKLVDMSNSASTNESFIGSIFSTNPQEKDVIRNAESSHQCMIHILVEADVLIIGGETVYFILFDEDDIVYERASTSKMVDSLIVSLLEYLNIFFAVSEKSKIVTIFQFKNSLSL